jgi:hypothetical protein
LLTEDRQSSQHERLGITNSDQASRGSKSHQWCIDRWLGKFLASAQGINKVGKLGRAQAAERHLVIVLDPFSPAGIGIPLALTARHDRGAADYGLPSFIPPEPLTQVWVLPAFTVLEKPFAGAGRRMG